MKNIIFGFISLFLMLNCMASEQSEFIAEPGAALKINLSSELFISGDSFSNSVFKKTDIEKVPSKEWNTLFHVSGIYPEFRFYKEIACRNNEVELNLWCQAFPDEPGTKGSTQYIISIPVSFLKGCKFRSLSYANTQIAPGMSEGVFSGEEENGKKIFNSGLYLEILKGNDKLAIDLQPCGSMEERGFGTGSRNLWYLTREGDYYKLVNLIQYWYLGGTNHFKIVLRKGEQTAYEIIHPFYVSSEYFPYKIIYGFAFGNHEEKSKCPFLTPFGTALFDETKGYGWFKNEKLIPVVEKTDDDPRGKAIAGRGDAVFSMKVPNGLYLVNVQSGSFRRDLNSFKISAGEKELVFPEIKKEDFILKTLPVFVKNGKIDINIQGECWQVNSIVVQGVISSYEDFIFSRSWWIQSKQIPDYAKFENLGVNN